MQSIRLPVFNKLVSHSLFYLSMKIKQNSLLPQQPVSPVLTLFLYNPRGLIQVGLVICKGFQVLKGTVYSLQHTLAKSQVSNDKLEAKYKIKNTISKFSTFTNELFSLFFVDLKTNMTRCGI